MRKDSKDLKGEAGGGSGGALSYLVARDGSPSPNWGWSVCTKKKNLIGLQLQITVFRTGLELTWPASRRWGAHWAGGRGLSARGKT